MMNILGVSALYHDSAAALIKDGEIIAAAQEERFTRKKADASIPSNAIDFCTNQLGENEYIDFIVYYDNPLLTLDRWLAQAIMAQPNNETVLAKSFDTMFSNKLWVKERILAKVDKCTENTKFYVCSHHISHAASAFYPSPFRQAAILTVDGVGEWATTTIGYGEAEKVSIIKQMNYPNSLGLLYSAFTYFCGFKVNFGEYKLMGLAPYGSPRYVDIITDKLVDIKADGSFKLNMDYFAFNDKLVMTDERFEKLFGVERRKPETKITKVYMDIAASIQSVTEEIMLRLARHAKEITKCNNLVMAGGTALNCVANGVIQRAGIYDKIWIQPAAGDAGGALGAALYANYNLCGMERCVQENDSQKGSFLGPEYSNAEIEDYLHSINATYMYVSNEELYRHVAEYVAQDKVIGLFSGKMEYGPRALGARSIIANPMSEDMQSKLNLKIKYRESFRPFAPAVLYEDVKKYFKTSIESPYMLFVDYVSDSIKNDQCCNDSDDLIEIVNRTRSTVPAITHVDYSARIQTLTEDRNTTFYYITKEFKKLTGCSVIINTSFNVRGEPIVCTPEDAYRCFMRTEMDVLILGNYVLLKENQPVFLEQCDWRDEYELD